MLSPACFRKASEPSRSLVQSLRGSRLHASLGSERPSATDSHGWCRTTLTTAGRLEPGHDRRLATAASSEGHKLWTSSALTHHLSVAEHRCRSQDSRKLEQEPWSPCPRRYGYVENFSGNKPGSRDLSSEGTRVFKKYIQAVVSPTTRSVYSQVHA